MKTIYFVTRTNDDGYEDCLKWLEEITVFGDKSLCQMGLLKN